MSAGGMPPVVDAEQHRDRRSAGEGDEGDPAGTPGRQGGVFHDPIMARMGSQRNRHSGPNATVPGGGEPPPGTPPCLWGYLTSALITRHRPKASGSRSQKVPVTTSWVQFCPEKPPSYIWLWSQLKSTHGWAFSNQVWFAASSMDRVGTTNQ